MIREFLARRKVRKAFAGLLSPKAVDSLLQNPNPVTELREQTIHFVCVSVSGETTQSVKDRIALVGDIAVDHEAVVLANISGVIVLVYGLLSHLPDMSPLRPRLCEALNEQLSENIKIIHGSTLAQVGILGGQRHTSFGFIAPNFLNVLAALAALPYGETKEYQYR